MAGERAFLRATELARKLVAERVLDGATAVDATVGNGVDLVFLSGCVGPNGRVIGFDLQPEAIERSRVRWSEAEVQCALELHAVGHERMAEFVEGEIAAAMFNLGWLPGGDKSVVTRQETTVAALELVAARLRRGGVVTVVCYPGHEGGAAEAAQVSAWAEGLEQETFSAVRYGFLNQRNAPPFLVAVERRA